jgi:hypothetical protein
MGLGRIISTNYSHELAQNPNASWLVHSCSTLVHEQATGNTYLQDSPRPVLGGSRHLPPYSILCAWLGDQHPNVILSRDSQVGVPKFPKLGL